MRHFLKYHVEKVWELPNKYKWLENKLQELRELEKSQTEKLFSDELNRLKES
ncbi:1175_t:CDS:2 [Gigaspora rosea]|nr:1175_t:CDS:2 [Gigaspora rosea]